MTRLEREQAAFWRTHWRRAEAGLRDAEQEGPKYRALRRALAKEFAARGKDCYPYNVTPPPGLWWWQQ